MIGQAICFELSKQGANLALTDPSKSAGQELCLELHKMGHTGPLLFAAIEYKDLDRLSSYVKGVSKTLKKIDGLVNCATFSPEVQIAYFDLMKVSSIIDISCRKASCIGVELKKFQIYSTTISKPLGQQLKQQSVNLSCKTIISSVLQLKDIA